MTTPAIIVDGLWKRYHKRFGASTLWSFLGARERTDDEFWALRDVSFEVQPGECLGIIGPNGSGKSTLLKILSRITNPTRGRVRVNGRVASMLEVGTGFHSELTGRENVYLSGAILGMSRAEIRKRFDAIVAFSGVEDFIDVPVKRYSSGMYVRLAFAVAAHVETDILICDEVLAVGDAEFQKKCLGRMGEVGRSGRTVLFVTHNMAPLQELCDRTAHFDHGRLLEIGPTESVVRRYVVGHREAHAPEVTFAPNEGADLFITRAWLEDETGTYKTHVNVQESLTIGIEFQVRQPTADAEISVVLSNSLGVNVLFTSLSDDYDGRFVAFTPGTHRAWVRIKDSFLVPDAYTVLLNIHHPGKRDIDRHEGALTFTVEETGSRLARYDRAAKYWSCVLDGAHWKTGRLCDDAHAKEHVADGAKGHG